MNKTGPKLVPWADPQLVPQWLQKTYFWLRTSAAHPQTWQGFNTEKTGIKKLISNKEM